MIEEIIKIYKEKEHNDVYKMDISMQMQMANFYKNVIFKPKEYFDELQKCRVAA